MKRIGLMGCGTVAGYGHLPALRDCPDWELAAIFEPDAGRLAAAKKKFNVPNAFQEVEPFFESGIDAIAITSPAPCHIQNVRDAVRYGKHILCEKPLAMNEAEAEEMIALTRDAGLMLFTGFTYRFGDEALKVKDLVDQGVIGDILSLRLIYIWNCHGRYEIDENGNRIEQRRREGRMLEGGPLVDCGVHQIDLARWWLGSEIVRFQSAGAWVQDYEAPDHVYLHLDHENGAHTMVELSYTYCHTSKDPVHLYSYDLIGTDGVIRYDGADDFVSVRAIDQTLTIPVNKGKNFPALYQAFARAVETGKRGNLATATDGLIATRIARTATDQAIAARVRPIAR
ncbi:MAG: Gfo/Idh/MocA family oxidoreductase [Candidatus Hydrogenedentes bacterium]|nr:Gfo/Idh/MocA family oxidoreductase [Candidatus Hydrogenedentota bacterium]